MNIINAFPNRVVRRHRYPVNFHSVQSKVQQKPKVNIMENNELFVIQMAIPGLTKSDIEMMVKDDTLTIGASQKGGKTEIENYTRREFSYVDFKRHFSLPETIDLNAINATMNNGILTIHLPKKEEAKPQPARKIDIA